MSSNPVRFLLLSWHLIMSATLASLLTVIGFVILQGVFRRIAGRSSHLSFRRRLSGLLADKSSGDPAIVLGEQWFGEQPVAAELVSGGVATAASSQARAGRLQAASGSRRVLLVEGQPAQQELLRMQLATLDVEVDLLESGYRAAEAVLQRPYGLVIIDCANPHVDGRETVAIIRQMEADGLIDYSTPIAACVSSLRYKPADEAFRQAIDDVIRYPLREADLRQLLADWLPQPSIGASPQALPISNPHLLPAERLVGGAQVQATRGE